MIDFTKAVVVVPPIQDFYFTYHRFSAIGALIVQKIARSFFKECQFLNFPLDGSGPETIALPQELRYLKKYIIPNETGPLCYFRTYNRYGPSIDICAKKIIDSGASCCLISVFAFCYSNTALQLIQKIKLLKPDLCVIAGGAGVSVAPDLFLQSTLIDYVVKGEAEVSLPLLLQYIHGKNGIDRDAIPNIGWRSENKNKLTKDIRFTETNEIIPCAVKTFETQKKLFISTTLSRGCRYKCEFCSNRLSQGNKFRTVAPDAFKEQLAATFYTGDNAKQININFEDDNIMHDYAYLLTVLQMCKQLIPNCTFTFENGIDYRLLDSEKCRQLIHLGVCQFNFSLATANSDIADKQRRIVNVDKLDELYRLLKSASIPVVTYFICGFSNDTHQTIIDNLKFLNARPTLAGISMFYAVPGIEGFKDCTPDVKTIARYAGSSAFPWNNSLSTTTLLTAFRLSRLVNLMKQPVKSELELTLLAHVTREQKLLTITKNEKKQVMLIEPLWQDYELVKGF
ncbi:MAG: B12-binding domain-containing radical SAM protein, partial [Fibrobacterota bacterium]